MQLSSTAPLARAFVERTLVYPRGTVTLRGHGLADAIDADGLVSRRLSYVRLCADWHDNETQVYMVPSWSMLSDEALHDVLRMPFLREFFSLGGRVK